MNFAYPDEFRRWQAKKCFGRIWTIFTGPGTTGAAKA